MSRWLKRTLIGIAVVIALMLLSMLVVPWQVKKQGPAWIAENTTRSLTIEKVFFNPFTLSLEISGTRLTEQDSDETFVSFSRLMVSASLRSVIQQALILDRIELDVPYVKIDLLGDRKFNFSDFMNLGGSNPPEEDESTEEPFHFSFNNIILSGGKIDFNVMTSENRSHHEIRQLEVTVPFIGNTPYLTDDYVEPQISMLVNGAELVIDGQLKPFHESLETDLFFSFHNADLAFYAAHSPSPLPLIIEQGILDFEVDLSYLISESEAPRLMIGGEFVVSDLDVREPDGSDLLRMPTMILSLSWADIFRKDFNLSEVELYEPDLFIRRNTEGGLSLVELLSSSEAPAEEAEAPERDSSSETKPFLLHVDELVLSDGLVHFRDDAVSGPFEETLRQLQLQATNVSTHPRHQTNVTLELTTGHETDLSLEGTVMMVPLQAQLDLIINGLPLEPLYPYLETALTQPIKGQLNLASRIDITDDNNLQLRQTQLTLRNLLVPFDREDRFSLAEFHLNGSSLDLNEKNINLGNIRLNDGQIRMTRLPDGSLTPIKLLRQDNSDKAASTAHTSEEQEDLNPWTLAADVFDLEKFQVMYIDKSFPRAPQINLDNLNIHSEELSYPEARKSPFELSADLGSGSIHWEGTAVHTPLEIRSQSRIENLPLVEFNNFIPGDLNLNLKTGRLFSTLALNLDQQTGFGGDFAGQINITDMNLQDPLNGGELLTWNSLNLNGINGNLAPFSVHMEKVALTDYLARIEISPEGEINLARVKAAEPPPPQQGEHESSPQEQEPTAETGTDTAEKTEAAPADIRIDEVTLQGGTVAFTDRHLPSTFSTTMYELGGRVSRLSSDPRMQADVDLRGELENHSPLTVSGRINPLSSEFFADLNISFKDIDLSPLTPYSGTYLGYAIEKGKLYLDLNYQIDHQRIRADNKVLLDQFNLGESIKSEKAINLPIGLAIALLKNRDDEIHLDIPISGNLADPDFSLTGTIFTVLRNLLVKAATSPFSLLASMLGGERDFSDVTFPAGRAALAEAQEEKITKLAEMLSQRPSLILEISGYADKENDPEAFRQYQLRQKLIAVKRREKEEPDNSAAATATDITPEEYPELLETVYEEADFPRPRNLLGMLTPLPPEEMEKLLLANIRAGEEEMAELARERARTVREELVAYNDELKSRLFLKETDIYKAPEEGTASRVEFGIDAK